MRKKKETHESRSLFKAQKILLCMFSGRVFSKNTSLSFHLGFILESRAKTQQFVSFGLCWNWKGGHKTTLFLSYLWQKDRARKRLTQVAVLLLKQATICKKRAAFHFNIHRKKKSLGRFKAALQTAHCNWLTQFCLLESKPFGLRTYWVVFAFTLLGDTMRLSGFYASFFVFFFRVLLLSES